MESDELTYRRERAKIQALIDALGPAEKTEIEATGQALETLAEVQADATEA